MTRFLATASLGRRCQTTLPSLFSKTKINILMTQDRKTITITITAITA